MARDLFESIRGFFGKAADAAQGQGGTMMVTPEASPFLVGARNYIR